MTSLTKIVQVISADIVSETTLLSAPNPRKRRGFDPLTEVERRIVATVKVDYLSIGRAMKLHSLSEVTFLRKPWRIVQVEWQQDAIVITLNRVFT